MVDSDGILQSKKHSKRVQKYEQRKLCWQERKQKRKEQKKLLRRKDTIIKELDMAPAAVMRRKERQMSRKEGALMALEEGHQVLIDCGFEDQMTFKEKKSLSQQIMYSYGINRRSVAPMRVYITSLSGKVSAALEKINGFKDWVTFKPMVQCYTESFDKSRLVYLTADSPNTIERLEKEKIYIIGGIVDRNRLKNATYKKALAQGIDTARLPLDQHLNMNACTRVLTVNHVFEILVRFAETKSWGEAALKTLPSRKGVEAKSGD